MATVDMSFVQFYQPPINPPYQEENNVLQLEATKDNAISLHGEKDMVNRGISDDESEDSFPTTEQLLRPRLSTALITTRLSPEPLLQSPEKSALYHQMRSNLASQVGENRESRDSPIVIEDDDTTGTTDVEDEVYAAAVLVDESRAERHFSQPVDSSTHDCHIDESPPFRFEVQDGSAASIPAQGSSHSAGSFHSQSLPRINQHNIGKISRSSLDKAKIYSPTKPPPTAQIDINQEWEIREVIGKEDVDGIPHYLVVWSETLLPITALGNAMKLVNGFEARLRGPRGFKCRLGRSKRGKRSMKEIDSLDRQKPKRSRASSGSKNGFRSHKSSKTVLEMNEDSRSWDKICAVLHY